MIFQEGDLIILNRLFYERGCIALCNLKSSTSFTSVYLWVVERLEWPSNCCIALKSAPPDNK